MVTDVKVDISKTGGVLTSSVQFSAAVPTSFMQIFGQRTVTVSGTATATYQTNAYIDFYMLLDNSPSMGWPQTTAEIKRLKDNTPANVRTALDAPNGCAFACHATDPNYAVQNTLPLAESLDIQLRIDVVRDATKALTVDAKQFRQATDQYRMAVYSFGTSADDVGLKELAKMNTDMDQVAKATDQLELMSTLRNNYLSNQMTDYGATLTALLTTMGTSGKGTSSTDRQKILFLVSDGVTDAKKAIAPSPEGNALHGALDTTFCDAVKKKASRSASSTRPTFPCPMTTSGRTGSTFRSPDLAGHAGMCLTGLLHGSEPRSGPDFCMRTMFRQLMNAPDCPPEVFRTGLK